MLSSNSAGAWPHFATRTRAQQVRLKRAIDCYPLPWRAAVQHVAADDTRLADLALSFPALLFIIAVPHTGINDAALKGAVFAGAPLKSLAQMARLPFWLRKLPPQAFRGKLGALPDSAFIQGQIVNHLPMRARDAARWLSCFSFSAQWGHDAFALWVAKLAPSELVRMSLATLRTLALWAWASAMADTQLGALCRKKWHPGLALKQAVDLCGEWVDTVSLHLLTKHRPLPPKFRAATIDGYDFVHLSSSVMIADEADCMRNCIRGYGRDLAYHGFELWSLRRNGRSLATISVGESYLDGLASITEIKAADNRKVGRDVAIAARRWLQLQDVASINFERLEERSNDCAVVWRDLFKPYWLEKRTAQRWPALAPEVFQLFRPRLSKCVRWTW